MARAFRPRPSVPSRWLRAWPSLAVAFAVACAVLAVPRAASAQNEFLTFRQQIRPAVPQGGSLLSRRDQGDAQMLVTADQIDYDYTNDRVAAVGNVQIS